MKYFAIAGIAVLFMIGAALFLQLEYEQSTTESVHDYVTSRGAAPMPPNWRGLVGKGI